MADDKSLKSRVMIGVGQMMYVKCLSAAWFILLVYSTVFEKTCLKNTIEICGVFLLEPYRLII